MVYYLGMLEIVRFNRNILYCKFEGMPQGRPGGIRFNRNILYCKCLKIRNNVYKNLHLIGTFCIVNLFMYLYTSSDFSDLIGTFCIVNTIEQIEKINKTII